MDDLTKAAIAGVVIATVIIAGIIIYESLIIKSHGEIIAVGVSTDTASIDWGKLYPNSTAQAVVHLWGNGTVPITVNMTAINWEPAIAENYLAFTWNYTGEIIGTDHVPIAITLHVDEGIQGFRYFNVDLLIQAKEAT